MNYFYFIVLFPLLTYSQNTDVVSLLTSDTWNIAYSISSEGVRTDAKDDNEIRTKWVKFNADGTFEWPGGVNGKLIGNWTYHPDKNIIEFKERGSNYQAVVEEISDLNLVLNYIDEGGFRIGLIHFVYVPKEKSADEINGLLTSGKWLVELQRFEDIVEKTSTDKLSDTWFEFNADGTYKRSEIIGEEPSVSEGSWFIDDKFQLNLDSGENTIYTVVGDRSKLILTTIIGGYNTIELRKLNE